MIEAAPGTRFLVAGSGTHEAELHSQAEELGLMEHGTFLGWIGDDVLHSLYRIADLTVVPSIYEPFGLVALEAMASGCPCIVADTGGLREVVPHEEAGLRFRARDPEALAEVAIRVLSDAELGRRLVAEAYEHVRRFDWADVAAQTAAVYAEPATANSGRDRESEGERRRRRARRASSRSRRRRRRGRSRAPRRAGSASVAPGVRWPCSRRPIAVRWREARRASCSCERPARTRSRSGSPRTAARPRRYLLSLARHTPARSQFPTDCLEAVVCTVIELMHDESDATDP